VSRALKDHGGLDAVYFAVPLGDGGLCVDPFDRDWSTRIDLNLCSVV
jgi:hypothetical protein